MAIRTATGEWHGNLKEGKGTVTTGSGVLNNNPYSFNSRFEEGTGTNPEELIGAAHAGCFSMAFSNGLSEAGFVPNWVRTNAKVHFSPVDGAPTITLIELNCEADVPGINAEKFTEIANSTKTACPISRALAAVPLQLNATLVAAAS